MNRHPHFFLRALGALVALLTVTTSLAAGPEPAGNQVDWTLRIHSLGGTSPGTVTMKFGAAGISRPDRFEYGTTFSPDGDLFFFGVDLGPRAEIHVTRWKNGEWTDSEIFLAGETASYNDPMMSADGERLYFITDQENRGSFDIAYVERTENGWSGVEVAPGISTRANEYFWSASLSGDQFFARNIAKSGGDPNFDIFHRNDSTPVAGEALSAAVNSPYYEGDPFVSADGNTLLFVSNRPGGAGRGDLYVSFRALGGNWQAAIHLDSRINTTAHELTPYITPDGDWLLFARDGDIYWVSTSLLDDLRAPGGKQ